jgi:hypothetical protein
MERPEPFLGRFLSKFLMMVVPGVAASAVAVAVVYAVHVSRAPEPIDRLTDPTPQSDGLSTEERRELTRQMLKERRENPQQPALVKPTPTLRPSTTALTEESAGDIKTRAPAAAPLPAARPTVARARPEPVAAPTTTASISPPPVVAAPSSAVATVPAPPAADPTTLPPVVVNTDPTDPNAPPPSRSIAGHVFSSISTFAGTAANATGNTVNWVIELPGKAISAGGRLLGGGDSASSNPPSSTPAPGLPPPPKRNYL